MVIKKDGRHQPFDISKVERGIRQCTEKLAVSQETIDTILKNIEDSVYRIAGSKNTITSQEVGEETLRTAGAVSADCASEMLSGVCDRLGAECAVSVTGIAGPGGGTAEKPVGLVYIGVRYLDRVRILENRFRGSREQIRARTAAVALNTLRRLILGLD